MLNNFANKGAPVDACNFYYNIITFIKLNVILLQKPLLCFGWFCLPNHFAFF